MKKLKITKESLGISLILILSGILNFANIGIEGYGNSYYAAGVKSMTLSLKNFFFVSFDPGSFVTIDKPPLGFWIQAIFAKIFGFSGWSILLPQALAGVISVYLIYYLVKKSFGAPAGLISAICLAITPVFVAASRNNTIDNLLVVTLLFACVALTVAAERGKLSYLIISLILVGIGFNIKMLEAYMIGPAIYITYLLSSSISFKKKIGHLVIGTIVLFVISLSWAVIVDLVPPQDRPFVGSSTDNSVLELIIGHNGLERLGLGGKSGRGGFSTNKDGGDRDKQAQDNSNNNEKQQMSQRYPYGGMSVDRPNGGNNARMSAAMPSNNTKGTTDGDQGNNNQNSRTGQRMSEELPNGNGQGDGNMQPPNGGRQGGSNNFGPGGQGGVQGSFGGQTPAGIMRLFAKNSLSDQIIWFLPLALLGFLAGAIKEKLRFKLDNKRKISLVLWFVWLIPEFIYFSFTTGLFHPYYLTMMAPPTAALAGIGIVTMWDFYKEGKWKAWLLPLAFLVEGITHAIMLSYFSANMSITIRNIIIIGLILCFAAGGLLAVLNIITFAKSKNNNDFDNSKSMNFKKILVGAATIGMLITPFIGSSAAITHSVNSTIPCAGLELLSNKERGNFTFGGGKNNAGGNSDLVKFLINNKSNEKYLLVVVSSQSADNIIIQTGEPVMALGGFSGSDKILTLDEFKVLVKNGEVRYVLTGGMGGRGGSSEIINWVTQNGKLVPESEYKESTSNNQLIDNNQEPNSRGQNMVGFGGNNTEQLYDLKDAADSLK